ncbi:MAG: translation initiation factor IF-6 [Promethearchaeota archaeon]
MLERLNILGAPTIGIHAFATDRYCLLPGNVKTTIVNRIETILEVPCIQLDISIQKLVGVMLVGNSNGILVPNHINPNDEEIITRTIKEELPDINIRVLEESKLNALGNLIAANDSAAIVSSKIPQDALKPIEDVLGVEVMRMKVNNSPLVGTKIVVNSKGCMVSPLASDEEMNKIQAFFKVEQGDFVTVCHGMEAIRIGIIANSNGAIVGDSTSGPEAARIAEVLDV